MKEIRQQEPLQKGCEVVLSAELGLSGRSADAKAEVVDALDFALPQSRTPKLTTENVQFRFSESPLLLLVSL